MAADDPATYLSAITEGPPDGILGIAQNFKACIAANKVNLVIGAYRTEEGEPWVLPSVKAAEQRLIDRNENKEYATQAGVPAFVEHAMRFAYGEASEPLKSGCVAAVQVRPARQASAPLPPRPPRPPRSPRPPNPARGALRAICALLPPAPRTLRRLCSSLCAALCSTPCAISAGALRDRRAVAGLPVLPEVPTGGDRGAHLRPQLGQPRGHPQDVRHPLQHPHPHPNSHPNPNPNPNFTLTLTRTRTLTRCGIPSKTYRYLDRASQTLDFDGMLADL